MEQPLGEELLTLFRSDQYLSEVKNVVDNKSNIFKVNVYDLPREAISILLNSFTNNETKREVRSRVDTACKYYEANQKSSQEIEDTLGLMKASLEFGIKTYNPNIVYYNAPSKNIRDIDSEDIGKLFRVNGCIISVTSPKSIVKTGVFKCPLCDEKNVIQQTNPTIQLPDVCICGNKKNFTLVEHESTWDDYQELMIQENPDEIVIGVIPRTMKIVLVGKYLVDKCQPGDVINLTTTMGAEPRRRGRGIERVYEWFLKGVWIEVVNKDSFNVELTQEDIEMCIEWSEDPRIREVLVESIYPSIYGLWEEKYGLTLCTFGGVEKKLPDILFRGQSNCLLIGDPGTAKTAMIQAISKVAPKAIYTQAGGSSGVGLTAAAIKDGDQWILAAGSVVLANGGVCAVDELEKMSKEDMHKLLECMEIQTVSIHKANIHTTLNAKTAILAAANPKFGRYDPAYTVAENIDLAPPLLARFDLIFIVRDIPEYDRDSKVVSKIIETVTEDIEDPKWRLMTHDEIKKYILYAKTIKPILSKKAREKLSKYYLSIRAKAYESESKPIPITPRQMQGLIRLTQAHARMGLKKIADDTDAEVAINLMNNTLIRAMIDPHSGEMDVAGFESGRPKSKTDREKLVIAFIPFAPLSITKEELMEKTVKISYDEMEQILRRLTNASGSSFMESEGKYSRIAG